MATYYPSLSGRGDNFQTPYPVDQKQAFYSELPSYVSNMTIYNQPTAAGSYSETMFPAECCLSSQNAAEIPAVEARNEMLFIPPTSGTMDWNGKLHTGAGTTVSSSLNGDPQAVSRTDHGIVDGEQNFHCQGLSLSLGTQMQAVPVSAPSLEHHFPSAFSTQLPSGGNQNNLQCFLGQKNAHNNNEAYDMSCYENTMLACKYLKAAQELLDEVVSVRKALKKQKSKKSLDISKDSEVRPSNQSDHIESTADSSSELSPDERQDLQNKKTKLLSMLDEVDGRYKQYYHQMQTLESSFDMVAGHGAAKSYTALALQTISRHLRCLRDAISGQIEVIRKRIGEQDNSSNSQINIPRLRYVDHQLRQQRALQQLGVMQHAWRPQRGLPESSVSILRAWLFEHFLHPYPNDTEKLKLAKQTGLTKNQVANWFINARVRLWKPMVEEMYKEEFGDSKTKSKSSVDDANKACGENNLAPETCPEELQECVTSRAAEMNASKDHNLLQNNSLGLKVTDSEIMKLNSEKRMDIDDHSLYPGEKFSRDQNVDGRLISDTMAYNISELSGFAVGNHVSLALGLQPHENEAFAVPAAAHIRGNNITSSVGPEAMDYLCMNHGKQQDRFGNAHLLSDFAV